MHTSLLLWYIMLAKQPHWRHLWVQLYLVSWLIWTQHGSYKLTTVLLDLIHTVYLTPLVLDSNEKRDLINWYHKWSVSMLIESCFSNISYQIIICKNVLCLAEHEFLLSENNVMWYACQNSPNAKKWSKQGESSISEGWLTLSDGSELEVQDLESTKTL